MDKIVDVDRMVAIELLQKKMNLEIIPKTN